MDGNSVPLTRVELHAHLDGSVRAETIWEVSKTKGLPLPGDGSFRALKDALVIRDPIDLAHFLEPFKYIIPILQNDLAVIERVAYEFIEDKARDSVAYVEARLAPHGLLSADVMDMPHLEAVVGAVSRGLNRGREDFGVDSRMILCTLIGLNTAEEVLSLCQRTQNLGVVAIDTASVNTGSDTSDEVPADGMEPAVFQQAEKLSIHRTVHAGERGPAKMVQRAIELYKTERIGHGYRVLEDEAIYSQATKAGVHLECCPWSSLLTGAVPMGVKQHPIVRFAEDRANFSINTDDTTITGYTLSDDYSLFRSWKLTEAQAVRASLNAVNAAFLTETERNQLQARILKEINPYSK